MTGGAGNNSSPRGWKPGRIDCIYRSFPYSVRTPHTLSTMICTWHYAQRRRHAPLPTDLKIIRRAEGSTLGRRGQLLKVEMEIDNAGGLAMIGHHGQTIRVEFEGAVYHVMARGNERQTIFRSAQDRALFLETLGESVAQFGLLVHVDCLMPNHYHLVVATPRGNLSRAIGWLQVTYTVRFNRRHRRSGHLFQGRFKAQLVDGEEYGRELVRYVHLNPVRPR
ncbi:MAG: hypothetical protein EXS18_02305, partial [Verrucomicrobiae bacterium]|nr:hypothetical protein [Verrucomicrobiae bacterium]